METGSWNSFHMNHEAEKGAAKQLMFRFASKSVRMKGPTGHLTWGIFSGKMLSKFL